MLYCVKQYVKTLQRSRERLLPAANCEGITAVQNIESIERGLLSPRLTVFISVLFFHHLMLG